MRALLVAAFVVFASSAAFAQNALTISEVKVDRATLHTAGVQVLISGDANRNATIAMRYTDAASVLRDAPALFRVLPETVTGRTVPEQFAGTIFDLEPASTYMVELIATDPDGGNTTRQVQVTTRALPLDPPNATVVQVGTAAELQNALSSAQPGHVIQLMAGTYAGSFTLSASGTAQNPIVIRGASTTTSIIDGENCGGCNILEISGSHIRVQDLTIRNGVRGLRLLGTGTTNNAVLRTVIEDVVHGIGSGVNQTDFTICDNVIAGRLQWPLVSSDDGAIHNDDQGIRVDGSGHVVCHNEISGFGDPMLNFTEGGRAYDFYGNDIHEIYGDGTELDRAEGNVRLFHNRFTNVYTAISIQPAYGGPLYVLRNVAYNVADEQIKLKSVGGTVEPSGVLVYHNTFVSPARALNLQTPITQHNFVLANNLFVGPAQVTGRSVDWTAAIDRGEFDSNGYYPDSGYWFGTVGSARIFANLAAAQAASIETNGRVLDIPIFEPTAPPPATYATAVMRQQLTLASTSNALDAGRMLAGLNSHHIGAAPDLGAVETGCPAPHYGPRINDLTTNQVDCSPDDVGPGPDGAPGGDGGTGTGGKGDGDGGCCQTQDTPRGSIALALLVAVGLRRRRRA